MLNCLYGRIGIKDIEDKTKIVTHENANKIIDSHFYSWIKLLNMILKKILKN
jgi:hypothetical protein